MSNDDFKKFSDQYIKSCREQISTLAQNPEMLEKALEPFMKMQQEYLNNPESTQMLSGDSSANNNQSSSAESDDMNLVLQKISHRVQAMRKKVLPDIANEIKGISSRLSNIENHLGIAEELTEEVKEEGSEN